MHIIFYATTAQSRIQMVVKSNTVSLRHKHSPETLFIHINQCICIVLALSGIARQSIFHLKYCFQQNFIFENFIFLKIYFSKILSNFILFYFILINIFFSKISFTMNSVHLLTQEKYRVEKTGLKIKSSAQSWPARAPRAQAARLPPSQPCPACSARVRTCCHLPAACAPACRARCAPRAPRTPPRALPRPACRTP